MGESDGAWGDLAEHDSELSEEWDSYDRLPTAGVNDALDAFCARKNIDIPALVRLGTRLAGPTVLAFAYVGGLKYRDMETDKRWNYPGSDFLALNILRSGATKASAVIVAEGETDSSRLSMLYPDCDVAALPAGAKRWISNFGAQLDRYERVLVATDVDEAGDEGWAKIKTSLPHAERFARPDGVEDWAAFVGDAPPLPTPTKAIAPVVFAGELSELDYPEIASWYEHELLPIGGQLIVHGPVKSFKSFIVLDLLAALAQGRPWAGFEPLEEAVRVCVVQFEIPPDYYRKRVDLLRAHAADAALFDANFGTWTPLQRPRLRADDPKSVDELRRGLEAAGVQVVLVDPVRRALGTGDINSEQDARKLLAIFERLQDDGRTVIAAHHDNKSSAKNGGGDVYGMTGTGAFSGDADTLISVAIPKGKKLDDPQRNLHFLIRNGRGITPRGFTMRDDGRTTYSDEPHFEGDDEDDGTPSI